MMITTIAPVIRLVNRDRLLRWFSSSLVRFKSGLLQVAIMHNKIIAQTTPPMHIAQFPLMIRTTTMVDNEITVDIHDPWVLKFFKWELVIGRVMVTSINGVLCNYSLRIKDKSIKKMLFNGIYEEKKNHPKREENLFARMILKRTDVEKFVTKVDGIQFIELKNHFDCTR